MSYAGPASRSRDIGTASRPSPRETTAQRRPPSRQARASAPRGRPPVEADGETDWQQVAIFGAGLALGIAVGAGAALLAAPRTGAETRAALAATVGRTRRATSRRGRDAWEDLRHELRSVSRAIKRRKVRHELEAEELSTA